jgi:hypothetical protein
MKNKLPWTLLALMSAIIMTLCPLTISGDVFAEEDDEEDNEEEREEHNESDSNNGDNEEEREEHNESDSNNGDNGEYDGSDQESETDEELDSGGDCNISGKGNTCIMVPANVEASGSAGPTFVSSPVQETPMLLAMPN